MNDISAVSPRFFFDLKDFKDLIYEFGPYNGRFISNYPSCWLDELNEHLKEIDNELSTIDKQKVNELKARIKESILVDYPNLEYESKDSWTTNVKRIIKEKNKVFYDVIGDVFENDPEIKTWSQRFDEYRENRVSTISYKGFIPEYIKIIRPLLKINPAMYLIDPYLQPASDFGVTLLTNIFQESSKSKCYKFIVFARRDEALKLKNKNEKFIRVLTIEEYKEVLNDNLKRHIPKNKSLTVNLVTEKSNKTEDDLFVRLHDRYFLTKLGAVFFGKGFFRQNRNDSSQYSAGIVGKNEHLALLDQFINPSKNSDFIIDSIEIKNDYI